MKPQKRARSSEEDDVGRDRLSEMPDEIIVHILSCMPTLDAVRTVLFRRFGNLWTLVHSLNFDILDFSDRVFQSGRRIAGCEKQFYIFVRNVLLLHKRLSLDKFNICVAFESYDDSMEAADEIKMWLRFVLDRQAKEIIFCDSPHLADDCMFTPMLPNFTCQSLVKLELDGCTIDRQLKVKLGSLKILLLDDISMCEEALQNFISGCPSLQELRIKDPFGIKKLRISAPSMNKLCLVLMNGEWDDNPPWLFDFPNVKSLSLDMNSIPDVIDVSSLRDIYIQEILWQRDNLVESTKFKFFLRKLEGTEGFQLSPHVTEGFLHSLDDDLHLLQPSWKRVVLNLPRVLCESCLLGIYQLLRSLKHLEELTIYTPLTGAEEVIFLKRVSSFERASTRASVLFA